MKRAMVGVLVLLGAAVAALPAAAQGTLPVSVEGRLDAGLPVGNFHDTFTTGLGWGLQADFDVTPSFAVYGGYSRFDLPVKGDSEVKAKDDGADIGARLTLGSGAGAWTPFLQFGVLLHDETGFEAGLGADYPVAMGISITPVARYRKQGDAQYVALGVGLRLRP
jgi:hypothetical protein